MIAPWAGNYVGIPFKPRGRDQDGLDCYGLLRAIYRDVYDITLPSYAERYSDTLDRQTIAGLIADEGRVFRAIEPPPQVGDAVLLRVLGYPIHVGVLVSERDFLHTLRGQNAVIERLDAPMWERRILGFVRHEALA